MNNSQIGLTYLQKLTPWNGRGGFALDGVYKVLKRLGDPQDSYRTVHVAGTNGKGTVSAAIASILGSSGYRVGLNSSPHLHALNERVVVDGFPVDMSSIGEFAYDIRSAAAKDLVELSFHEAITVLGFLAFREIGVEWGVIEVGLGGRLDSSNVISRPSATAIVTIDFDHQHILGNTLAQIAAEKAGIIKKGSPLVVGSLPKEAMDVVNAKAQGIEVYRFGQDFGCSVSSASGSSSFVYWHKPSSAGVITPRELSSSLVGGHQAHNLSVAATLGVVLGVSDDAITSGIKNVFWPGRLERIVQGDRAFVLDGAHNPAGVRAFCDYVRGQGETKIDLTFGVLDTKNWQDMVRLLAPVVGHWRLVLPESERALPMDLLQEEIRASCNEVRISMYHADYDRLLRDLLENCDAGTRYITGSLYMVGRMREMLSPPLRPLWEKR